MATSESISESIVVGLTGSIGSGKSAAGRIFEACGIPVLRSDEIARELMVNDPKLVAEIRAAFGNESYLPDGSLNRAHLAQAIFNDPAQLQRMNALVHPRTIAEQGERAQRLIDAGNRVVMCEAALIYETQGEDRFDYIVVVDADRDLRLRRASARDGVNADDVLRRDAAQMPAERKVERADFVIHNNDGLEELERTTRFIASVLRALPPRERMEIDDADEGDGGGIESDAGPRA